MCGCLPVIGYPVFWVCLWRRRWTSDLVEAKRRHLEASGTKRIRNRVVDGVELIRLSAAPEKLLIVRVHEAHGQTEGVGIISPIIQPLHCLFRDLRISRRWRCPLILRLGKAQPLSRHAERGRHCKALKNKILQLFWSVGGFWSCWRIRQMPFPDVGSFKVCRKPTQDLAISFKVRL